MRKGGGMSTASPHTPFVWRMMRRVNSRVATRAISGGRGPRDLVLLLTTTGRRSGLPRTTPLQYEEAGDAVYVASVRGAQADWFRNAQADPLVTVQMDNRRFDATAEAVLDPVRIADFLAMRLTRRPVMMRLMLLTEGVAPWSGRRGLERIAAKKALLVIRPRNG